MSRLRIVVASLVVAAAPAYAHFKLVSPASRSAQDALGGPQKSSPCGESDATQGANDSTPTNTIVQLKAGGTVTVSINETITHPGHYRVALAQDMASLPPEPTVSPGTGFACGSAPVDAHPQLPVLADGLFTHTSSFNGHVQTAQVQLPAGMTCNNCVLQVIEFMSDHGLNNPGGCFYHHCSIVNITADGPDAGVSSGDDAGTTGGTHHGGCDVGAPSSALLVLVGALLLRRRR
ncbi:MAG: lytic polysaccharide monooxygenase [Deltaproteobacteria bacterium]|nr:lytic polysaccharide monooxygenase [Deltaproteobacteria bacterium]